MSAWKKGRHRQGERVGRSVAGGGGPVVARCRRYSIAQYIVSRYIMIVTPGAFRGRVCFLKVWLAGVRPLGSARQGDSVWLGSSTTESD